MASVVNQPGRKRPRPANASNDASRRQQDSSRPQKRSRPSGAAANTTTNSRSSAAALLRGPNPQVARNRIGGQETTARGAAASRPSLSDVTPSQIQNKPPPRRRSGQTKAPRTTTTAAAKRPAGRTQAATTARRRQQESSPEDEQDEEGEEEEAEEDAEGSEIDDDNEPPSPEKPYAHIAPYTRRVRQSTIETKWSALGKGSIKALSAMLNLAHRPVLQRLAQSESRRVPTEKALELITKRILDKVRGIEAKGVDPLPFPPASLPTRTQRGRPRGGRAEQDGGRETELNFESVLDAKQTLERQLDPVLHAVDLLGQEARRMEEELEKDYETLRLLEAEARTRARDQRGLLKRAHVLAPESAAAAAAGKDAVTKGEDDDRFKFEDAGAAEGNPFRDVRDGEVRQLVAALGGHVDKIRSNMAPADGIGEQIAQTRAALQNVLARKLGAERYGQVSAVPLRGGGGGSGGVAEDRSR